MKKKTVFVWSYGKDKLSLTTIDNVSSDEIRKNDYDMEFTTIEKRGHDEESIIRINLFNEDADEEKIIDLKNEDFYEGFARFAMEIGHEFHDTVHVIMNRPGVTAISPIAYEVVYQGMPFYGVFLMVHDSDDNKVIVVNSTGKKYEFERKSDRFVNDIAYQIGLLYSKEVQVWEE